ncbi:hypothetical protein [Nocardioides sp. LML1-1-1.1]|uniref:hypothetical protein n=1 Tax=Nocardioides sp. LML1-1-1.1 TaxID=3135248 RepID=UPI003447366D
MTPIKRPLAAVGAAALLALSLTACGGSSPTDASEDDFCASLKDTVSAATSVKGDEPTEDEWKDIQKAYQDLGDTGTPKGIGDDERNGFEVITDAIGDLDYDEAKKSFGDKDGSSDVPGVSKDDQKDAEKFFTYAGETCQDALGGGSDESSDESSDSSDSSGSSDEGSESSSESTDMPTLPTDMPTGLPSDFPTEIPTDPSELQSLLESYTANAG